MNSRWIKSESVPNNNNDNISLPRPGGPLKPRLCAVQKKIQIQISQLQELHKMLKVKDEEILHKLMTSIKDNNIQYSTMLSTELAKEMKVSRVVLVSKITLEMLSAKLSSASDFRDLVIILSPIMAVVKNLRSSLTPLVPEMEDELGIVAEILSGILVDAGQVGGYTINFETANEEAVQLIDEASRVAEEKMNTEFPEIPDLPIVPSKIA